MKKKIVINVLGALLFLGGVALAICYIVIPQETKSAMDILIGYLNTPLGIAGGTTITLGLVIYVVVKAIAKYLVGANKINLDQLKKDVVSATDKAKEYENLAHQYYDETKEVLADSYLKIVVIADNLIKVCEQSPNAKIRKVGEDLKEELDKAHVDFNYANLIESVNAKYLEIYETVVRKVNEDEGKETTND